MEVGRPINREIQYPDDDSPPPPPGRSKGRRKVHGFERRVGVEPRGRTPIALDVRSEEMEGINVLWITG